jgi:hypothetical protein
MTGLVPVTHDFAVETKSWMAAPSTAVTVSSNTAVFVL